MCQLHSTHYTSSTNELWIQQQASPPIFFPRKKSSVCSFCLLRLPADSRCSCLLRDGSLDCGAHCSRSPVSQRGLPALQWADVLQRVRKESLFPEGVLELREVSPREDSSSHRRYPRRPHLRPGWADFGPRSGTSGGTAVGDKKCLSLSKRKVVKRQGLQLDQTEMCSHHPNLGWRIMEEKHESLFLNQIA